MGRANVLVEGIDGSGKDTFVSLLSGVLKERFDYAPEASLSIVGQPAFCFDDTGRVRALVERGEVQGGLDEAIRSLVENRRLHEAYLERYGGVVVCSRGVLTEMATLARIFGCREPGSLGQTRPIDLLVIIDADPAIAYQRILSRQRAPDWRETPENLGFFRRYYLEADSPPCVRGRIVYENARGLAELAMFAAAVADRLERCWT
jgi:thymidylate kinase